MVITIIATLLGLMLPAIGAAKETARRAQCANNLRQIGLGLTNYHSVHRAFPVGCTQRRTLRISWLVHLLPYIEQQNTWRRFDFGEKYNSEINVEAASDVIATYVCPSTSRVEWDRVGPTTGDVNRNGRYDPGDDLAFADYGGMFGAALIEPFMNGVLIWDKPIRDRQIPDGLSHTIMVGEDTGRGAGSDGQWANGENVFDIAAMINTMQDNELWSDHPHGVNVTFCDGSVHFLRDDISVETLGKLATREGREYIDIRQ